MNINKNLRKHTWHHKKESAVRTHPQCCDSVEISISPIFFLQVVTLRSLVTLTYFPQFDSFVFEWEKKDYYDKNIFSYSYTTQFQFTPA